MGVPQDKLGRVAVTLAAAGIAIAAYLSVVHYQGSAPVCVAGGGGCETVQSSQYAELAAIPVAVWGLGYYLTMLLLPLAGRKMIVPLMGLSIAGLLFSGYLTYLELFVINAICQWCVGSAVVATLLAVVHTMRFWRSETTPQ